MMAEKFIGVFFETEFDFNSCLKPNDISNLVNNCLVDIPLGKFALYANERPLEKSFRRDFNVNWRFRR